MACRHTFNVLKMAKYYGKFMEFGQCVYMKMHDF